MNPKEWCHDEGNIKRSGVKAMPEFANAVAGVMEINGATACSIVDIESGECLARAGVAITEHLAAAGMVNARMLRSKIRMAYDQYAEGIEDVLVTLDRHYHLIRLIHCGNEQPRLFLYVVLGRAESNLAMARRKLAEVEYEMVHLPDAPRRIEAARARHLNEGMTIRDSKVHGVSDEIPAFMRDDVVLKLLGIDDASKRPTPKLASDPA